MTMSRQTQLARRTPVLALIFHVLLASALARSSGFERHAPRQARGLGKARLPTLATRRLGARLFDEIIDEPIPDDVPDVPIDDLPTDEQAVDASLQGYVPTEEIELDAYTPEQAQLDNAAVIQANGGLANSAENNVIDSDGWAAPISAEELQESISFAEGQPLCARGLGKRCDMGKATSGEVGWLARALSQPGAVPEEALASWLGKVRSVGRTKLPDSNVALGGILRGFLGLRDPVETSFNAKVAKIAEEASRLLDAGEVDLAAGSTLLGVIKEAAGEAAAIPKDEVAITRDLAMSIGDNAFAPDATNTGIIKTTYSFFKLIRKLCQSKAFIMDFTGRSQLNELVQSQFDLAAGGSNDVVWRMEDEMRNLQAVKGGNILSHFKAAWRMSAAIRDAYKAGDGVEVAKTSIETFTSGLKSALNIRNTATSERFFKISLDAEIDAWQAFLEPHIDAAKTGNPRSMYLSKDAIKAVKAMLEQEYGANDGLQEQIINTMNGIFDSTYGDIKPEALQHVIRDQIIYKLDPGSAKVVPELKEGEMSSTSLVKVMADVTTGGVSTSAIKEFFTSNLGKTAIVKGSAAFESAVLKFADSGAPITDSNKALEGSYPLTRAGMRKFAETLLEMQDLVNKADADKRAALINRLSVKARADLSDLTRHYRPGYTSDLDIFPISNRIQELRNDKLDALKYSAWDYDDISREILLEIDVVEASFQQMMRTASRGLAFSPESAQSQEAVEAFGRLLSNRYGVADNAVQVMKKQLLNSGYGSQAINKIRLMLHSAVPYMGNTLIDFYKIPDGELLKGELKKYQKLKNIGKPPKGGSS